MSDTWLMILPALALVLGLIWLAGQAARRGWIRLPLAPPGGGPLSLVQTLAIDSRRRLHLVRCDGRDVLVLTGGPRDAVLNWRADKPAAS